MISVFASNETDFSTLGICVLKPISCRIEEIAGGMLEATIVHPITDDEKWRELKLGRILRCPAPTRESPEIVIPGSTPTSKTCRVYKCVTSGRLYIRDSVNGRKIDSLAPNEECLKLAEDTTTVVGATWYKVAKTNGGAVGWVLPFTASVTYLQDTGRTSTFTTGGEDKPPKSIKVSLAKNQLFRINRIEIQSDKRTVKAYARHITYDLIGVKWRHGSAAYSITTNELMSRLRNTTYVTQDAGINLINYCPDAEYRTESALIKRNAMDILLNESTGALTQADGRLLRDNFNLYFIPNEDRDLGFSIRYGKNLLSANYKRDIENVVTRVLPLGKTYTDGALWGTMQESPKVAEYGNHTLVIEYDVKAASESSADVAAARARLNTLAVQEFTKKHRDEPRIELDADIVQLELMPQYLRFANEYAMHLYDTVMIVDKQCGINVRVQMTSYEYDALAGRYTSVEFGNAVAIPDDEHDIRPLEYIQSSNGNAYIDTGIKGDLNTEIDYTFIPITARETANYFGDMTNTSAAITITNHIGQSGDNMNIRFGNVTKTHQSKLDLNNTYKAMVNKTNFRLQKNGTTTATVVAFNATSAYETSETMYCGACRTASGISSLTLPRRDIECVIRKNGSEVARLRPVLYDGEPCMYDYVANEPHFNIGSGSFTAGPMIPVNTMMLSGANPLGNSNTETEATEERDEE